MCKAYSSKWQPVADLHCSLTRSTRAMTLTISRLETASSFTKDRGFASIGLHFPKNSINFGGVLRAAHCYGASLVAISGTRMRRQHSDVSKAWRHIPTVCTDDLHSVIPYDTAPVAIELIEGARPLCDYVHPQRAFYVFGPEDSSLGAKVIDWCRDVIYVPTNHCMNLAACCNVVLYDRLTKTRRV